MSSVAETLIDAPATTSAINLTVGAVNEVRRIMAENKIPEGYKLRVGVTGGGCSGMSYALGFDMQKEGDDVYVTNGIEVIVDRRHLLYLNGVTVDYVDGLQGRGFTFNNPNATKTCGCGSSFSA
ncbi:MAG: HesB/IscA family protein [Candidatus Thermochlorobacter sp.]